MAKKKPYIGPVDDEDNDVLHRGRTTPKEREDARIADGVWRPLNGDTNDARRPPRGIEAGDIALPDDAKEAYRDANGNMRVKKKKKSP